jgi:hypothetical protein
VLGSASHSPQNILALISIGPNRKGERVKGSSLGLGERSASHVEVRKADGFILGVEGTGELYLGWRVRSE